MFLRTAKFCYNHNLFHETVVCQIGHTSNRNIVKFSQDIKNFIANTQNSNQNKEPKLIFGGNYLTDRTFSTRGSHVIGKPKHMANKEETEEFMSLFPGLVSDFIKTLQHADIPELRNHLERVLQYNVPIGKKIRGLGLVVAYKMIESPENLNSQNIQLAYILGWCVEVLVASLLIYDDIVDQSETRRGTTCWYKVNGIGLQALNDGITIENGVYLILQKYFANHPNYVKMLEAFHAATFKVHLGQCSDIMCMTEGKPNFELFTMKTYKVIAKLKTSHFTTDLPITLAMHLSQKYDEGLHLQAKEILLEMGEFYQIQNDFMDCFGDLESKGKNANDICEGKCTWLAVLALQRGNPEQIKIFKEHYGKGSNDKSEQIVRNLYEELGLPHIYATYERESFDNIRTRIQQTSKDLPHEIFIKFMENMYGR